MFAILVHLNVPSLDGYSLTTINGFTSRAACLAAAANLKRWDDDYYCTCIDLTTGEVFS